MSKKKPINRQKRVPAFNLFKKDFWTLNGRAALVLFTAAIALYIYSISFDYVLDDQIVLTNNAFTQKGIDGIKDILTKESFVGRFGEQRDLVVGARYRPLSIVTFALEYEFWGLNSTLSHLINVLLYAFLTLLLYRVLCVFFVKKIATQWYFSLPFIIALLFVVHPVHSEVVANVKGRDELMASIGALAALYYSFKIC